MFVWAVVAQRAMALHVRFAIWPIRIQAKAILASKEIAEAEIVDRLRCRLGDLVHCSGSLHIRRHDKRLVDRTTTTEVGGYPGDSRLGVEGSKDARARSGRRCRYRDLRNGERAAPLSGPGKGGKVASLVVLVVV
jgi:hypothetical protein